MPRLAKVPPLVVLIALAGLLMMVPATKAALDHNAAVGRAFFYWGLLCLMMAGFVAGD